LIAASHKETVTVVAAGLVGGPGQAPQQVQVGEGVG